MNWTTEQRLLRAAVSEFAERGYKAATVRGIINRAGEKNLNAVVYYFGGKEELYKALLDFMFTEADKFRPEPQNELPDRSARTRLEALIRFLCLAFHSVESELDRELYRIFVMEAGNPSPYFSELVERHLKPSREYLCDLLREYLGPDVTQRTIDDLEYSISAQILYGVLGWSIIGRTRPETAAFSDDAEDLADHVVTFSMAALKAFRSA